jgi:hypothetical protein
MTMMEPTCDALTRTGEKCRRLARVHHCLFIGTCLAHYCTQHNRSWAATVEGADHTEVYTWRV